MNYKRKAYEMFNEQQAQKSEYRASIDTPEKYGNEVYHKLKALGNGEAKNVCLVNKEFIFQSFLMGDSIAECTQSIINSLKVSKEVQIYPKYVWADNAEGKKLYSLYTEYSKKPIGTRTYAEAGAPGIGHVIHEITRIDENGIYGILIENTMRVPDLDYYM